MPDSSTLPVSALDANIRRTCAVLERVAKTFDADSEEYAAIKDAAFAFTYVQLNEGLAKAYALYCERVRNPDPEVVRKMVRWSEGLLGEEGK